MKRLFFALAFMLSIAAHGQTFLGFIVADAGGGPQLEEADAGVVLLTRTNLANKDSIVIPLSAYSGTYKRFEIVINGITTDQWTERIEMYVSDDGGTTYDNAADSYGWNFRYGFGISDGADADTKMVLMTQVQSNNAPRSMNAEIKIYDPASSAVFPLIEYTGVLVWANDQVRSFSGGGFRKAAQATTHLTIRTSTGTMDIASIVINGYTF